MKQLDSQQQARRRLDRKLFGIAGVSAAVVCILQCQKSGPAVSAAPSQSADAQLVSRLTPSPPSISSSTMNSMAMTESPGSMEQMARTDPLGFAEYCLNRCRERIKDYRCTFIKQEKINGTLLDPQTVDVRFRSDPFSVDMTFVENVRSCARALFVKGKWKNDDNQDLAWVKPGGAILRAIVPRIKQPIHGPRAEKESRRTIDQFGFERTLELIIEYARKSEAEGMLDVRYIGTGEVNGRPTYLFERHLPYDGDEDRYPDRVLVYQIDQQYLVPVSCIAYADDQMTDLLGSYVYHDVEFNVGYTDSDFDPEKIDF